MTKYGKGSVPSSPGVSCSGISNTQQKCRSNLSVFSKKMVKKSHVFSSFFFFRPFTNPEDRRFPRVGKKKEAARFRRSRRKWGASSAKRPSQHSPAHARCLWLWLTGNPSPSTCRRILHPARTRHIFEQGTLPHLFSPLLLLIDWRTKARERVTCQTKRPLSSLEKETWRRMEGIQVALLFPLALIRHFSVSH